MWGQRGRDGRCFPDTYCFGALVACEALGYTSSLQINEESQTQVKSIVRS